MTFLNPFILFGLIASSIPIIIHLLNLRKLKKIEFSTLAFLKELQKNKIRKIKIKQILLLILRTLIIILLVLAFARPVMKGYLSGFGSHAKTSVVIILDDSYSMNLNDELGQYFKQAKSSIFNIINQMEEGDDLSLIRLSDLPKPTIKLSTNYFGKKKEIENYEPRFKNSSFSLALRAAGNLLLESKSYNKEIYLISDEQKCHYQIGEEESKSIQNIFDNNTRLFILNIGKKEKNNSAITKVEFKNNIFETEKPVKIESVIKNDGIDFRKDAILGVYLDGKRVNQKNINIESKKSSSTELSILPKKAGFNFGYTELEDDELVQDNKLFFSFYIPEKIKVLLVSQNLDDNFFLKMALNASNRITDSLQKSTAGIFDITEINVSTLGSYNLLNYNMVILSNLLNINEGEISRLKNYLESGRGLIIFPQNPFNLEKFNDFLSKLGLPTATGTTGSIVSKESFLTFSKIDYEHPIFYGMFRNAFGENVTREKGIDSPEIFYSILLQSAAYGQSIITMSNNTPFLYESKKMTQRVLVFAVVPNISWSDFPVKGIFLPLISRSIYYLSNNSNLTNSIVVGEELSIKFEGGEVTSKELILKNPNGVEEKIQIESNASGFSYIFNSSDIPGVYVISNGKEIIRTISVNVSPIESDLSKITKQDLEKFLQYFQLKNKYKELAVDDNLSQILQESRYGVELWRFAIIFVLILLVVEMLVARDSRKQIADLNT